MAQYFHPLYIVNSSNEPLEYTHNSNFNTTNPDGTFGPATGIPNNATGDGTTHDKVYRLLGNLPRGGFDDNAYPTVDVVARVRIPSNGGTFALIARAGTITASNTSYTINGYATVIEGGTNYRRMRSRKYSGNSSSDSPQSTHLNTKTVDEQDTTYRYVRLTCAGSTITSYAWWDGDNATDQARNYVRTDTAYTTGVIGFISEGGLVDIDFISIGTGADSALTAPSYHKLDAVVYQPPVGGDNSVPVSGGAEYPVRAYHRNSGTLAGYVDPSTTDATCTVGNLAYGNTNTILTATDLDSNAAEWIQAIAGPVTPVAQ